MTKNTENKSNDTKKEKNGLNERKVILLMGMGLNGINADGWFSAEGEIDDTWAILESVDTFIMGRVTYQMWERHWPKFADDPSSNEFQKRFSVFVNNIQKIVFSKTLKTVHWQNSRVVNTDIATEIERIKKLSGKDIVVVGGVGIAQSMTKLNLIDDYQLYLHPVIFGTGGNLLGLPETEKQLELIETKEFLPDGIRLHFRPVKEKIPTK